MWDERFLFVLAALFGIAMWIGVAIRHNAVKAGKKPNVANAFCLLVVIALAAILGAHIHYYSKEAAFSYPGLGGILALAIGGVVGSFSARFVWSLFGASFGAKDPLIGVLALAVLIVVYSLPVYHGELSALLGQFNVSAIKTPVVELSFTERPQGRGAIIEARKATGEERASAIPHPSNPRPGLEALDRVVSDETWGYLPKDDRYIAYFGGAPIQQIRDQANRPRLLNNPILVATKRILEPVKELSSCLQAYVRIFPDSQLLLVDIKPMVQSFFRMHAHAVEGLQEGRLESANARDDALDFRNAVKNVQQNVLSAVGAHSVGVQDDDLTEQQVQTGNNRKWMSEFARKCGNERPGLGGRERDDTHMLEGAEAMSLNYLQPYVTIALANLLVAHGSSDEAVEVLAQWLDLWDCARGEDNGTREFRHCKSGPLKEAAMLPEWFRIRAEFELSVLLYDMAGEANITYRDFLKTAVDHFAAYAEQTEHFGERLAVHGYPSEPARRRSISIGGELKRCQDATTATVTGKSVEEVTPLEARIRATILRSLLQNENTLVRSELHFLAGQPWPDMENWYERAVILTRFPVECINPEGGEDERRVWAAVLADYKITAGLLAVAIADRLASAANSMDERDRAVALKQSGKEQLRAGYRSLKKVRDDEREKFAESQWSIRVFSQSGWEESCFLAERALHQLSE